MKNKIEDAKNLVNGNHESDNVQGQPEVWTKNVPTPKKREVSITLFPPSRDITGCIWGELMAR